MNLAHFGGYHESNPDDFGPCTDVGPDWEQLIAEVAGDFANAYADIGYWTESYAEGLADGIRVRRNTRRLLREHPVLDERLMFGTDWSMLGREPTHPEYIAAINNSLELVGLDTDRLFYRNAIAYLGLTEGSPQWQRLERFFGAGRLSALSSG